MLEIMDCKRVRYNNDSKVNKNNKININVNRARSKRSNNYKNNRFNIAISILALAIIVCVLLGVSESVKAAEQETVKYKYFSVYYVEQGDSLWSLAREYSDGQNINDYIDEVKNINHLHSDNISAGQMMVLPYYSTEYME